MLERVHRPSAPCPRACLGPRFLRTGRGVGSGMAAAPGQGAGGPEHSMDRNIFVQSHLLANVASADCGSTLALRLPSIEPRRDTHADPHRPLGQQPGLAHPPAHGRRARRRAGGDVELTVEPGRLVVRPSRRPALDALLARITAENLPAASTTRPRGRSAVGGRPATGAIWSGSTSRRRRATSRRDGARRWCSPRATITSAPRTRSSARSPAGSKATHSRCAARRSGGRRRGARRPGQEHRPARAPDRGRRPRARRRGGGGPGADQGAAGRVTDARSGVDAPFTIFGQSAGAWSRCRGQPGAPRVARGGRRQGYCWMRVCAGRFAGHVVTEAHSG